MSSLFIRLTNQQQKIIKILIIAGVLSLSLLLGQLIPPKFIAYVLILVVAFGALLVFIRNPQLGILAVLAGGMLVNFELGTSTSTSVNLAVILLPLSMGIWFVDRFVRQREIRCSEYLELESSITEEVVALDPSRRIYTDLYCLAVIVLEGIVRDIERTHGVAVLQDGAVPAYPAVIVEGIVPEAVVGRERHAHVNPVISVG